MHPSRFLRSNVLSDTLRLDNFNYFLCLLFKHRTIGAQRMLRALELPQYRTNSSEAFTRFCFYQTETSTSIFSHRNSIVLSEHWSSSHHLPTFGCMAQSKNFFSGSHGVRNIHHQNDVRHHFYSTAFIETLIYGETPRT